MLSVIETINTTVNNFIWGVPAMICIIGVGLYLIFFFWFHFSMKERYIDIRRKDSF